MLKPLLIGALLATLGYQQPAKAAPSLCWFITPDSPDVVDSRDCDVTLTKEDDLKVFYVDDVWRIVLWADDTADVQLYDENYEEWPEPTRLDTYEDEDGDVNIDMRDGYRLIFRPTGFGPRRPTSDTVSPGITRGSLSDTPFRF